MILSKIFNSRIIAQIIAISLTIFSILISKSALLFINHHLILQLDRLGKLYLSHESLFFNSSPLLPFLQAMSYGFCAFGNWLMPIVLYIFALYSIYIIAVSFIVNNYYLQGDNKLNFTPIISKGFFYLGIAYAFSCLNYNLLILLS